MSPCSCSLEGWNLKAGFSLTASLASELHCVFVLQVPGKSPQFSPQWDHSQIIIKLQYEEWRFQNSAITFLYEMHFLGRCRASIVPVI